MSQNYLIKQFADFKNEYQLILAKFIFNSDQAEIFLNEGYKLGRQAVQENFDILSLAAIHHDCLDEILKKLENNNHLNVAIKASNFLEDVLAPFQMVMKVSREAINLLNKRSAEFAIRIRFLQDALQEKEALLKEIHHRVKNNLQVIFSLLNLQVESTKHANAKQALLESVARVKSMALIHEMLYQTENLAKIEMQGYLENLLMYLYSIYDVDSERIKLIAKIDPIILNIDQAIPCGLIINELISNAFKHAFLADQKGNIQFSLQLKNKQITLTVKDSGSGFASNNIGNFNSLGLKLVQRLTKQLNGQLKINTKKGSCFKVIFYV